ncbi:MAG: iron-sulfur cluster assembly accessory protein [Actinobacteria bacterium]|nr:iron-sulfur cluster assembly accessory protein [Actinomycetota bacterium]
MSDATDTTVKETLDGPPVRETLDGPPAGLRTSVVAVTERAATKMKEFLAQEDAASEDVALRVAVQAGGCAGFQYALFFDDRRLDGDLEAVQHGVTVRVDAQSASHLRGATIDWKESLEASGFQIDNPNASSSCACGESFS